MPLPSNLQKDLDAKFEETFGVTWKTGDFFSLSLKYILWLV